MAAQLGIDVSKTTLEVVLLADGKRVQAGQFENSRAGFMRLRQVLKKRILTEVHVCLEATGHDGDAVTLFFHQAGYRVSVVNPLRIKGYTESRLSLNKTDSSATALIADFCQTQQPEAWTPPAPAYQELQALERHLHHVRQQEWNRRQAGFPPRASSKCWMRIWPS
jgi:transposase